jgi:hypothetical protein
VAIVLLSLLLLFGVLLTGVGVATAGYSLTMSTSVESESGRRVHNLGLMQRQRNWLTVGTGMAVVGVVVSVGAAASIVVAASRG